MAHTKLFITTFIVVVYATNKNMSGNDSEDFEEDENSQMFHLARTLISDIQDIWRIASKLNGNDELFSLVAWETSTQGISTLLNNDKEGIVIPELTEDKKKTLQRKRDALRNSFFHNFKDEKNRKYTCSLCIKDPGDKTLCAELSTVPTNNTLTITTKIDNVVQTSQNIDVFNPLAFCLTVPNLTQNRYCLMTYNMHFDNSDFKGCLRVDYHVWYERYDFPTVCVLRDKEHKHFTQALNQSEQAKKWKLFHESPPPKAKWL